MDRQTKKKKVYETLHKRLSNTNPTKNWVNLDAQAPTTWFLPCYYETTLMSCGKCVKTPANK